MAKVTAPLFGFSATGTIAKSVTFGSWKGVPYARQRVTPANPRSQGQTATRSVFSAMSLAWKSVPGVVASVFADAVQGKPETSRNRFIGSNVSALREQTDLSALILSPGTRSAPGIGALVGVAGSLAGEIDLTYGVPTLPTGWTLDKAHIIAIPDALASDIAEWSFTAFTDEPATGSITLDGLTASTAYAVCAFLEVTRPDGRIAYSASRTIIATTAA